MRAILESLRYADLAVFRRWNKHEELSDPDDVSAGNVMRFRRSAPDRVVLSRVRAHPAIISVETFTEVHLMRPKKAAGGLEDGERRGSDARSRSSYSR